jgi:hypothetical protein
VAKPKVPAVQKEKSKARSLANLKPFKPGKSGNPKGKPKGTLALKTVMRNAIHQPAPQAFIDQLKNMGFKVKDNSWDSVLMAVAMAKAASGSVEHLKEIWKRRDKMGDDEDENATGPIIGLPPVDHE